ncbi:MAG: glycine cleavage system protein GcvH [Elusimicrobia bacterium]|nr:glycine cleavage system protein GcvH [Elusimicrobiota bacterium]
MNMTDTKTLKYAKSHEWLRLDGNRGTVGITDFAQKEIRDIVYLELPKVGKELTQGGQAGMIESVKAAFEIYAPVSGRVVAVNEKVAQDVTLVHKDPYDQGWLFQIEIKNPAEANNLLTEDQYNKITTNGGH